jgi:hypothetical protein
MVTAWSVPLFNSRASGDFQPDYAIAVFIREPDR